MPFDLRNSTSLVAVTMKSRNRKVGPIPVTTSGADTCPDACPLKGAGCYADGGPLAMYWRKVTDGNAGVPYDQFLEIVAGFPVGQLWRHDQAGDLQPDPVDPDLIDSAALTDLAMANRGRRGFTYTHYDPIHRPENRRAIAAANRAGFTVNLSGNNLVHADQLAETDCGPVVTVLPAEYERASHKGQWTETLAAYRERLASLPDKTPGGRAFRVCPATYSETNCAACQLCQRQGRKVIVGFPAHGFRTRKADAVAQGAA